MKNQKGISAEALKVKYSAEVESLNEQLKAARSELDTYRKYHGKISVLMADVLGAVKAYTPLPIPKPEKKSSVASPCSIVMQPTDVHYGMVQDRDEVEGFGEYSPEISKRYQIRFAEQIINWRNVNKGGYNIDELQALVTGDMISGDIHPDLKTTNAFPTPVQAVQEGHILAEQIMMLAAEFPRVKVHYIGADNHGRLTRKPQAKQEGQNNWSVVIAGIAKALLQHQENVEFNFYPMYETIVDVRGMKYLITHGHNVRGWMGIPWYSLERKTGKEAKKRLHAPISRRFHKMISGHWHAPFDSDWYSVGGSCSGTDALDHKDGRESKPCQTAWMVHPKKGEFNRTNYRFDN